MKIAYFRGWDEKFDENLYNALAKHGEVYYPEINYKNNKNLIHQYSNELMNRDYNWYILGSSLGGYLGFYISSMIKQPALLFNPTFFLKEGGELISNQGRGQFSDKRIVFSRDGKIDIKRTLKLMKELGYNEDCIQTYDTLSLETYDSELVNLMTKYVFKKEEKTGVAVDSALKSSVKEKKASTSTWSEPIVGKIVGKTVINSQPTGGSGRSFDDWWDDGH